MNHEPTNVNSTDPLDELDGSLRGAVERCRTQSVSEDSMRRALERADQVANPLRHPRPWRRVVLAGAGMAAALLVAFAVWSTRPSAGWAQVTEAMRSRPWVHATAKHGEGGRDEIWFSTERGVSASRHNDWLMYDDYRLGVRYVYEPKEQTLYRVPHDSEFPKREFAAFREVFDRLLRKDETLSSPLYGAEVMQQERRRVAMDNQTWTEYDLTLRHRTTDQLLRLTFAVPPGDRLPRTMKLTNLGKEPKISVEYTFDYPERGPVDAYALGVPRSAKLIDRVPPEDLNTVLKGARLGRERFGPYQAIVVETVGSAEPWNSWNIHLVWRKGNRWRVEMSIPTAAIGKVEPPPPGTNQLAWWKQRLQGFDFVPVSVCDGKAVYRVDFLRPDKDGKQAREWKELWKVAPDQDYAPSVAQAGSFMPELFGYPGLPVPSQQFAATLERAPKEGPADTLLLTARAAGNLPPNAFGRSRYWIDPQHSYITLQFAHDELHGPAPDADGALRTESYVMERLEQTPSGIWYPTIVRRKNCVSVGAGGKLDTDMVTRFYLDFEAKLPDRLFDAAERER